MRVAIVLTSSLALLLSGCGSGTSTGTAAVSVVKPKINYRPDLVPLIVGSYSGECKTSENVPVTATVTVTAQGMGKTTTGVSVSLVESSDTHHLLFSRDFRSDGRSKAASFVSYRVNDNSNLSLVTDSEIASEGNIAGASIDSKGILCRYSPETIALKTKSLVAPVAKFLNSSKKSIFCSTVDKKSEIFQYQVLNGEAKLNDEIFSFTNDLKKETVGVGLTLGSDLVYAIETRDGRSLNIGIDNKGDLFRVNFVSKTGAQYFCLP